MLWNFIISFSDVIADQHYKDDLYLVRFLVSYNRAIRDVLVRFLSFFLVTHALRSLIAPFFTFFSFLLYIFFNFFENTFGLLFIDFLFIF
jgi:hypothetical protein